MTKYKYYFKQPKTSIAKDILRWFATAGIIFIAASSPNFVHRMTHEFRKRGGYNEKSIRGTFYRLQREGCFITRRRGRQIYISLTEKGRKKAGRFQIDHLTIKKPKKWDRKWRVIVFDISEKHRRAREALRGFFKRLNLYPLQKSVWISPYDCRDEIELLRDFFGLTSKEMRLFVTKRLEDDSELRRVFEL